METLTTEVKRVTDVNKRKYIDIVLVNNNCK